MGRLGRETLTSALEGGTDVPTRRPTVQGRRLGTELRRLREEAGISAERAAEHLECSRAKVSRMETGGVAVHPRDVRDLLDLYEVSEEILRARLQDMARGSSQPNWWASYGDTIPPAYADYIDLEQQAKHVRTFQMGLVPGLLQTADYARAIMEANPAAAQPEAVETLLKVRMERQQAFWEAKDPKDVRLSAVLWQPVVLTPIGGRGVMRGQLERLLAMSRLPNISIQILPMAVGAHAGTAGPFVILEFPSDTDQDVVFLDNLTSTLFMEKNEEIEGYRLVFDSLLTSALNKQESRDLISRAMQDL